jgi:hypothetical protein
MLDFGCNMEIVQLIIGIIVIVSVKFIIVKTIYNRVRVSNLTGDDLKFDEIRPIYKELKKGNNPKPNKIKKYAGNLESRTLVYDLLKKFNKIELFPLELLTIEKSSESYLVNWLNMNDDFDSLPSELNYKGKIELQNGITVLIYNFKVYEPHIYASKGLMIGYVGYSSSKNDLYIEPEFILSKFENEVLSENQLEKIKL